MRISSTRSSCPHAHAWRFRRNTGRFVDLIRASPRANTVSKSSCGKPVVGWKTTRLFFLQRVPRVDRFGGIGADLQYRAIMIAVIAVLVRAVCGHELDDL